MIDMSKPIANSTLLLRGCLLILKKPILKN